MCCLCYCILYLENENDFIRYLKENCCWYKFFPTPNQRRTCLKHTFWTKKIIYFFTDLPTLFFFGPLQETNFFSRPYRENSRLLQQNRDRHHFFLALRIQISPKEAMKLDKEMPSLHKSRFTLCNVVLGGDARGNLYQNFANYLPSASEAHHDGI